jgi:uncharacterized membrane protein YhaH (DUF805 family)
MDKYFSTRGRLVRLPYFTRSIELYIIITLLTTASIPLFTNGSDLLWWIGLILVVIALVILAASSISLVVRRLHDIGMEGYHAIWILPLLAIPAWGRAPYLAIPLIALTLWLMFWPGKKTPNQFDV